MAAPALTRDRGAPGFAGTRAGGFWAAAVPGAPMTGTAVPSAVGDAGAASSAPKTSSALNAADAAAFVAFFGHLMGYDAGYYGYAWADAISADMATVFEESPQGFYDTKVGRRLREEIYAPGSSRDVNISIKKFLGRERSIKPFLKHIGIETQ